MCVGRRIGSRRSGRRTRAWCSSGAGTLFWRLYHLDIHWTILSWQRLFWAALYTTVFSPISVNMDSLPASLRYKVRDFATRGVCVRACVCGLGFSRVGEQQGYGNWCVCGGVMAVKYVNGATGLCVVRCSREQYRTIWASITFITHLHNVPVLFNLLNLSGKAPCSCCCCCCCRHLTSVIIMIALLEASRHLKPQ